MIYRTRTLPLLITGHLYSFLKINGEQKKEGDFLIVEVSPNERYWISLSEYQTIKPLIQKYV